MRRGLRRAPSVLLLGLALVMALVGCSDDGGDDDTSPTTTSPTTTEPSDDAGDESTTTEAPGGTTASEPTETTEAGDPAEAEALTAEQAAGELERIFEAYRATLQGAQQRNALDEQVQGELAAVLAPALRDVEVQQLESLGVPGSLPAEIGAVPISDVEVLGGGDGCSWGSATIDFVPFYGEAADGPQTFFFRLTAGDDGTYRLDSLGFTETGEPYTGLECAAA
jgi:hypothetical protein